MECTQDCAVEGATYQESYGITSEGNSLTLSFVTKNTPEQSALLQGKTKDGKPTAEELTNVGSRTYLMDTDETYKLFYLKNREFSFDVDASNLPCGLNGALYFVEMAADGGKSQCVTFETKSVVKTREPPYYLTAFLCEPVSLCL